MFEATMKKEKSCSGVQKRVSFKKSFSQTVSAKEKTARSAAGLPKNIPVQLLCPAALC